MNFQGYFVIGMRAAAKRRKSLRANRVYGFGQQQVSRTLDPRLITWVCLVWKERETEELTKYSAIKHTCKKIPDSEHTLLINWKQQSPLLWGHILLWLEQEKQKHSKCGFTGVRIGSGRTIYYRIRPCLILANSWEKIQFYLCVLGVSHAIKCQQFREAFTSFYSTSTTDWKMFPV